MHQRADLRQRIAVTVDLHPGFRELVGDLGDRLDQEVQAVRRRDRPLVDDPEALIGPRTVRRGQMALVDRVHHDQDLLPWYASRRQLAPIRLVHGQNEVPRSGSPSSRSCAESGRPGARLGARRTASRTCLETGRGCRR